METVPIWIARDSWGDLDLFFELPERIIIPGYGAAWGWDNNSSWGNKTRALDNSLFPEITWDDEPVEGIIYWSDEGMEVIEVGGTKVII